jgi:hypothetical protein
MFSNQDLRSSSVIGRRAFEGLSAGSSATVGGIANVAMAKRQVDVQSM